MKELPVTISIDTELIEKMHEFVKTIMDAWDVIKKKFVEAFRHLFEINKIIPRRLRVDGNYFKHPFSGTSILKSQVIINKPRIVHARSNC